jgi:hypothetical protein
MHKKCCVMLYNVVMIANDSFIQHYFLFIHYSTYLYVVVFMSGLYVKALGVL